MEPHRDPERIPIVLKHLEVLWKKCPNLRLGQLIEIAKSHLPNQALGSGIFYVEDAEWLTALRMTREIQDELTKRAEAHPYDGKTISDFKPPAMEAPLKIRKDAHE